METSTPYPSSKYASAPGLRAHILRTSLTSQKKLSPSTRDTSSASDSCPFFYQIKFLASSSTTRIQTRRVQDMGLHPRKYDPRGNDALFESVKSINNYMSCACRLFSRLHGIKFNTMYNLFFIINSDRSRFGSLANCF